MKKILVTYATKPELVQIDWQAAEIGYVQTGIGKAKSAFHVTNLINKIQPDMVLNIGSAGTFTRKVGDIFVCRHFIDRDMKKVCDFDDFQLEHEIELPIERLDFLPQCLFEHEGTCNTGDSFLTKGEAMEGDIIDMEAYAQAFVCRELHIPFVSVKYVTDIIGQNSKMAWENKLKDAREALSDFLNR
jgi:adenosylhomocysteine nucleosidase